MKFGKTWDEVESEPATSGGGYMKYFKDGDTTFRIAQEPKDWVGYWEHFNPGGFPFPCTGERSTCPGCTSKNEKMKKASRKIAIQVVEGDYVNVYKFPKTLADKLANRANRIGTIYDRDYTISKIKGKNADGSVKVDYDLEGGDKIPFDFSSVEYKDVEAMLEAAYNESWGDSDKTAQTQQKLADSEAQDKITEKVKAQEEAQDDKPPFEEAPPSTPENKVWTEEELLAMPFAQLLDVCKAEGMEVPDDLAASESNKTVVNWLLNQ